MVANGLRNIDSGENDRLKSRTKNKWKFLLEKMRTRKRKFEFPIRKWNYFVFESRPRIAQLVEAKTVVKNRTPRGTCYNPDFISKILLEGAGEEEEKKEPAIHGQAGGEEYTV